MAYQNARRPSNGRSSFSNSNRSGGYRSGGNRSSGGRGGKRRGENIDYRRFIKKAVLAADTEEYIPTNSFADFGLSPHLLANVVRKGYTTPTPIQDQTIALAMAGKDVIGIANTGTGKTAAFLLPLIDQIVNDPEKATVLIIAPVRELAEQIRAELVAFTAGMRMGSVTAIGGAPIGPQIRDLSKNPHFIIGTPGRIIDLLERDAMRLHNVSAIVLDEVDRMLDMGFIEPVKRILAELPKERQSLFFSATVSPQISTLIQTFMNDPITVKVKTEETSDNVEQDVVRIGYGMDKFDVLHELLKQPAFDKVLVFGETKYGVERLAKNLAQKGHKTEAIHGNKSQSQRSRAIENFKRGQVSILVATDVAARGIDIKNVSHVINYDLPQTYADYTHRIGRTGRAGQLGYALTFIES